MTDNTTHTELPRVESTETIVRERDHGLDTIAVAYFDNGAQLRYQRDPQGQMHEETVWADDPGTVYDSTDITSEEGIPGESLTDPATLLETTLDEYNYYIENHAVAELRHDWSVISAMLDPHPNPDPDPE